MNQEATRGFVTNGFRLARREPPTEVSWGSRTPQRPAANRQLREPACSTSRFPYLEIPVAGDLGQTNLSLELIELATGKRIPVRPASLPVKSGSTAMSRRRSGSSRWWPGTLAEPGGSHSRPRARLAGCHSGRSRS